VGRDATVIAAMHPAYAPPIRLLTAAAPHS
jgi:hypothetical protein